MNAFLACVDALQKAGAAFEDKKSWPEPGKCNWPDRKDELADLERVVLRDILQAFLAVEDAVRADIDAELGASAEEQSLLLADRMDQLRYAAADVVQNVAAALVATSEGARARGLMKACRERACPEPLKQEMRAAEDNLEAFAYTTAGQFHAGHRNFLRADACFDKALKLCRGANPGAPSTSTGGPSTVGTSPRAYEPFVLHAKNAPRPLDKAPSLHTVNGIGTGLYGSRDRRDGTYIATLCFCVFFVPLIPLRAYRVSNEGGGSFRFFAVEQLSTFARWVRRAWLAVGVLGSASVGVTAYVDSDRVVLTKEWEAVVALDDAGERAAAEVKFCDLLRGSRDPSAIDADVPARIWASRTRDVKTPLTDDTVADATSALQRCKGAGWDELLRDVRRAEMVGWLQQLESARPTSDPSLSVAQLKARGAFFQAVQSIDRTVQLPMRVDDLNDEVVLRNSADWPLLSLSKLVGRKSKRIRDHVAKVLNGMPNNTETWALLSHHVLKALTTSNAYAAHKATAVAALALRDRRPGWKTDDHGHVDDADMAANVRWVKRHPLDAAVQARLAQYDLDQERAAQAAKRMGSFDPRWLSLGPLQTMGRIAVAQQRLDDAEPLLVRAFVERKAAFLQAAKDIDTYASVLEQQLLGRARTGQLPAKLMTELDTLPKEQAQQRFGKWLSEQMRNDVELQKKQEAFARHAPTASLAMEVGVLELSLASASQGAEKQHRLTTAEGAFDMLAQAGGGAQAQVQLGEVKIRLGKVKEGTEMLDAVVGLQQPEYALAVAQTWRAVGDAERARKVSEQAYEMASDNKAMQSSIANMRGVMATSEDDAEVWFKRSNDEQARISLRNIEGRRASQEGRHDDAAKAFADVATYYEDKPTSVAANNGGLARLARYMESYDERDLSRGVTSLRRAVRLSPQDPISKGNLRSALVSQAHARLLGKQLRLKRLRLSSGEMFRLYAALTDEGSGDAAMQKAARRLLPRSEQLRLAREVLVLSPGSTSAYVDLAGLLRRSDDVPELRRVKAALLERNIDQTAAEASYLAALAEPDDELVEADKRTVARLETALMTAKTKPEKAAVHCALGFAHEAAGRRTLDVKRLQQATAAYTKASSLWSKLHLQHHLARVEVLTAVAQVHGAQHMPAPLPMRLRQAGLTDWLRSLSVSHGALLQDLQKRPEWGRARETLRRAKPTLLQLTLQKLAEERVAEADVDAVWPAQDVLQAEITQAAFPYIPLAHERATMHVWLRGEGG